MLQVHCRKTTVNTKILVIHLIQIGDEHEIGKLKSTNISYSHNIYYTYGDPGTEPPNLDNVAIVILGSTT